MKYYQDLLECGQDERARMQFVRAAIAAHKTGADYLTAQVAQDYDAHRNRTINAWQRVLYSMTGEAVADKWGANFKMASAFFPRFVTHGVQYLLGNGVTWENDATKTRMGVKFDTQLQKAGKCAKVDGVAFGFWNYDHLEVFRLTEFAPLWDEETGALMAGIRFWQVATGKPLRATLYEPDGLTEYIWQRRHEDADGIILHEKRAYVQRVAVSAADGVEIMDGQNWPGLPIVPMWANEHRQSEIVGLQEQIDCYDLIKSGFANTVDEASIMYWTINNAGGMDDIDLAKFVERMKTVHASVMDTDGANAQSHTMEAPYASREALLERLRADLYEDAMALDTHNIASGAVTATQIKAAYEPLNSKTDQFEYCVLEFLQKLLAVIGIEDRPTFTRSVMVNAGEEIDNVVKAAAYLDGEYMTTKILSILGDADKTQEVLARIAGDEMKRYEAMAAQADAELNGEE